MKILVRKGRVTVKLSDALELVYEFALKNRLPTPEMILGDLFSSPINVSNGMSIEIRQVSAGYYDPDNLRHLYFLFCIKEFPELERSVSSLRLPSLEDFPNLRRLVSLLRGETNEVQRDT